MEESEVELMDQNKSKLAKNQPAFECRLAGIKAVLWANRTGNGVMYNTVLVRIYRDDQGAWQETHSLGRDDLLLAAKVLDIAHSWIHEQERKDRQAEKSD